MIVVGDRVVDPHKCDHKSQNKVSRCFHDWRIHWGNVPKQQPMQSRYVTDSP